MAALTFDTLKFVKELESAGISAAQAEAFVRAQQEIFSQTLDSSVALRSDIEHVDRKLTSKIGDIEKKLIVYDGIFKLHSWMLGILIAGVASLILKAFF